MSRSARGRARRWVVPVAVSAVMLAVGALSAYKATHRRSSQPVAAVASTSTTLSPTLGFFSDPTGTAALSATMTGTPVNGSGTLARSGLVQWTIKVSNASQTLGATQVAVLDGPGQGSNGIATWTLVPGSVATSLGMVTQGNAPGATTVGVVLGYFEPGTAATFTFQAVATGAVVGGVFVPVVVNQAGITAATGEGARTTGPPVTGACAGQALVPRAAGTTCLNLSG